MTGKQLHQRTIPDKGYGRIQHTLEFDESVTKDQVRQWLEEHGWLSYHPDGYGHGLYARVTSVPENPADMPKWAVTGHLLPGLTGRWWVWEHSASCD